MDVDASLKIVGLYSWVQVINITISGLQLSLGTLQVTGIALSVDQALEYYCKPSPGFTANETTPLIYQDGRLVPDGCHMYSVLNGTLTENITTCENGWEYPGSMSGETNTNSDFNLVCERGILAGTLISLNYAGSLIGCYITGQVSDIVGRRPVAICCLALTSIIGTAISFTWNLELMMALRFLLGMVLPGSTLVSYVRLVEMFTPKSRTIGNMMSQNFWALGVVMVAPIAYLLPNWRHFQLAISLGCLPFLPLHWFFSYESLRWLVQVGRAHKAEAILKKIAKSKNIKHEGGFLISQHEDVPLTENVPLKERPVPEEPEDNQAISSPTKRDEAANERKPVCVSEEVNGNIIEDAENIGNNNVKESPGRKYTLLDLFKTRVLIKHTCIIWYLWFACDIMYFGLIVYTTSLSGNKYLNFFLLSLVEFLVYTHDCFITRRFGRKWPIAAFFAASATACIMIAFLPEETAGGTDLTVLIVVIAMIGKFYSSASYDLTMLIAAEIFPTVLRNIAEGSAAAFGRIGGVVAPLIVHLGSKFSFLPMTIFALMSLVSCICILMLPETKNRPLPEMYEDVNKLTRGSESTR
ncbi:organic cation transporter protein-like [Patiria miniata]|uniref:Major facilitator superfamily (MFS) profile domain-containing protein n=1 Tax=Patiria miniata TaxID=46514 RepID=A0A913Z1A2_PATMI|nr:organic cation transporter protein-like [Patiria miniata]